MADAEGKPLSYAQTIRNLHVGAPETVAQKIASTIKVLGINHFQLKYSSGPSPRNTC